MKQFLIFTFILSILYKNAYSQDTLKQKTAKQHLNEFGLDVTPFIKYYFNFSGSTANTYNSNYFLTYRRYFKKTNVRSAIGGNYNYSETPSPYNGDSLKNKYHNTQGSIAIRIGYEFFQNLARRWQVYYGADIRANYAYLKNDAINWNAGYANGTESTATGIGLAPILGLRFKISRRFSILTESSILIQYSQNASQRYYIPVTGAYPFKVKDPKINSKSFGTTYNYPIGIIITFNI